MPKPIVTCPTCGRDFLQTRPDKKFCCSACSRSARPRHEAKWASSSKEYIAWIAMKKRCYNPNYEHFDRYGGRGIRVYEGWLNDFPAFLAYVGVKPTPRHSLDRFPNNDGNYEPGNVRWADQTEQGRNKSNNLLLCHDGRTQTAISWAVELGMKPTTLFRRIAAGWTIKDALTVPVRAISMQFGPAESAPARVTTD